MADLIRSAAVGTDASGDVIVIVSPAAETQILIHSTLQAQFGAAMEKTVRETLEARQLTARVELQDRGALDWILRARLETALDRAKEEKI